VVAGTDNFSYSNVVNQDVFTITNNFNLYKGKHSWTFGTHNEFFKIQNLFTIFSTPRYQYFFDGVNRFLAGEPADLLLFGHEQSSSGQEIRLGDDATNLGPSFNAMQLAFYAQDEIQVNRDFKLTAGLRFDIPIFSDDPPLDNTQFNSQTVPALEQFYDLQGARASQAPSTQILLSPRIGFNYDVNGDKTTQLRGGLGIFTSRVPWVWPGGMFIRNGLNSAFNVRCCGDQEILAEPQQWLDQLTSSVSPAGDVDLFVEDFKYPQIFRSSLAMDKKVLGGWDATFELTYTKTLNNMDVKQVNIKPRTTSLGGADNRPTVDFSDKVDGTYENITLVSNTNKGFTFNGTAQLSRQLGANSFLSLAYSFTRADALFDGRGFINNTNWLNVLSVQGNNNPSVVRSTFDSGSRITAFFSHKFDYSEFAATTVSLFYTGKSGLPYSYVYNNPISDVSDNADFNDLVYVPANQSEINLVDIDGGATADQQWAALDAFISGDDYLSERRGDYAEANEVRTPFENVLDLKIAQDFYVMAGDTKHKLQITLDVFNFTNMLNKGWGRRYFVGGNTFSLIQASRNDDGVLEYNFRDPGDTYNIVQSGTYSARWTAQLGLRYEF
nr:TonB-dependent receptor [Saprospiraceae bacterium]